MTNLSMPNTARNTKTGETIPCCAFTNASGEIEMQVWGGEETEPSRLDPAEWVLVEDRSWAMPVFFAALMITGVALLAWRAVN